MKKPEPKINNVALGDQVAAALNDLRSQLRAGEEVALPPLLAQMLPTEASAGDRVLIDNWRAWQLWAVFEKDTWQLELWQDGKIRGGHVKTGG